MTPSRSFSERIYAALLRMYPAEFRRDYGADMRDLFRDHYRDARRRSGLLGVIGLWSRTVPDLLFTGAHEHEDEMLHAIMQDARYAMRIIRKNPVFALVAVAVVALGTGAVSTIFSVANAIVLRPVPGVARPADVVSITRTRADGAGSRSSSYIYYRELATRAKTMSGVAAVDMMPITISTGGEGMSAFGNLVTGNYFDVLGVKPALGRFFAPDEDRVQDASPVVVISHGLWVRRFNADSATIGRSILLDGTPFRVIGVTPAKFSGLYPVLRTDAWIPMAMQHAVRRGNDLLTSPNSFWLDLVGRVAPGVTVDQARTELSGITKQYAEGVEASASRDNATFTRVKLSRVTGLPAGASTPVLAFFTVLLLISGLVLMIASVNVASMLLARAVSRRREIAVRIALGAGRARLVRQLLTESVLLFAVGGALGVVLAVYATRLLSRIPLPVDVPIDIDAAPDARVLVVTVSLAILTGIVFGLAPALQGSRGDVATALRGDSAGSGRARSRLRNVLVAGQVAASLLLLTTSGLFVRALARGHQVNPGYDITKVATAAFDVSLSGYDTTRARVFYDEVRARVSRIPGVTAAAFARVVPLSMNNTGYGITVPGYTAPKGSSGQQFTYADEVDPGYFDVLRLPIVAGRPLLPTDTRQADRVAVVSETFARRYWPGESALGKTIKIDSADVITIVGVARDVKFTKLDERPEPFMYLPLAQRWRPDVTLLVRTAADPSAILPAIAAETRAMDPSLPAPTLVTLERAASVVLLPQRFAAIVTAALGVVGLLLAAIGLYGVLSFSTAQRTREIGVRMALGATRDAVVRLVVKEGMTVVAIGGGIGLLLALVATQALRPFLFGVSPLDAATYVGMSGLLFVAATLACVLPARRAAAVDPIDALRQD